MHLVYLDESISNREKGYQVVGAILVPESLDLAHLEDVFAFIREFEIPDELQKNFEFHTSDLFNGRGIFEKIEHPRAMEIIAKGTRLIGVHGYSLFYGAVDSDKHKCGLFSDAEPITIGFKICLDAVQDWMQIHAPGEMCLAVFDNVSAKLRQALQQAFRNSRKPLDTMEGSKGKWGNLVDDLYFGDSAFSVGIQAADLCTYLIRRHLNGKKDTEALYQLLGPHIVSAKVVP